MPNQSDETTEKTMKEQSEKIQSASKDLQAPEEIPEKAEQVQKEGEEVLEDLVTEPKKKTEEELNADIKNFLDEVQQADLYEVGTKSENEFEDYEIKPKDFKEHSEKIRSAHLAGESYPDDLTPDDHKRGKDAGEQVGETGENPPSWVASESTWKRAKESAKKYKGKDYYWATVTHIYKNMGGKIK